VPPHPQINTVDRVDYCLIGLYLAVIVWVGFYAARQNRNTDDYFRCGGRVPWLLAGVSNWVSSFSAYMFVVAAGFTYRNGLCSLILFGTGSLGYLLGYFLIAPLWRRSRVGAPLEFLTRRFSPSTTWFYSVTAVLPQVAAIGQGIYILCIFGSTALGFNASVFHVFGTTLAGWQLCILIIGTVLILYSMLGGFWAAVLSDSIQGIIILVMTVILCPVAYLYLGHGAGLAAGVRRLVHDAPPGYLTQFNGAMHSRPFVTAWLLSGFFGYNFNWALVQRYQSVADERGARRMALVCAVLALVGPVLWMLPALASRVIFPDIGSAWPAFPEPAEASFVGLALTLLPHGMIGFVVSAILSATLGADNAALNWLSATVTHDLYVPARAKFRLPAPSEAHKLGVARATMLVLGVLGVAVAFQVPRFGGAFKFVSVLSSIVVGFMAPVGLGLVYRRTPWWSAIASCTAFLVAIGLCEVFGIWSAEPFARNMLVEAVVISAVFFGSAYWWDPRNPRNASILALDADLRTPVVAVPGESTGQGGLRFFRVLGILCLIFGGVLAACRLVVRGTADAAPGINLIAGVLLLALGWILVRTGRNRGGPETHG
jgi:solute:Na+ symporter, SSS family